MKKAQKKFQFRPSKNTKTSQIARHSAKPDNPDVSYYRGTITIAPGGFGFVAPFSAAENSPEMPDIFIPPAYIRGALNGDEVKVATLPPDPRFDRGDGRIAGEVVDIVKRSRSTIIGELISSSRVRPLDKKMPDDIFINGTLNGAKVGDWVEVELDYDGRPGRERHTRGRRPERRLTSGATGEILRRVGRAGVLIADLDAICAEYRLPKRYTAEEEEEAARLVSRAIAREDLRERYILTIDPFDAKDYDDAISIAPGATPETVEIGAHIADVASWIAPGGQFDRAAELRSFTAYLPGRTLPMLPKGLTAQISMRTDIDSPAHSVLLQVDRASGKVTGFRRAHTLLRVRHRLNYDEVQEFFDTGKTTEKWDEQLTRELTSLREITLKMREYRRQNEIFLDMDIPEIRVICDEEKNQILGLERKQPRESEQLIEECMLAANSAVAAELTSRGIPGLFRVHPEPDPEKLAEFAALSLSAFHVPCGDLSSRKAARDYLDNLPDDERKQPLLTAFLRSLARAYYQAEPALHFGLGKGLYSHFTSPIRRYPDLLVHQQLWAADTKQALRNTKVMEKFAESTSVKEANNDDAYYAASDRMKLRYLDEMLGSGHENAHTALVVKTFRNGALVELPELGIQGLIPAEDLPGAYRGTEKALAECKPGQVIMVMLEAIDFTKGQATFRPVPGTGKTAR